MMGNYGRVCRYRRIVEGLQQVLEDLSQEDGKAYEWVSEALRLMQERLDLESEAYYTAKEEEKYDQRQFGGEHDSGEY